MFMKCVEEKLSVFSKYCHKLWVFQISPTLCILPLPLHVRLKEWYVTIVNSTQLFVDIIQKIKYLKFSKIFTSLLFHRLVFTV